MPCSSYHRRGERLWDLHQEYSTGLDPQPGKYVQGAGQAAGRGHDREQSRTISARYVACVRQPIAEAVRLC